MYFYNEIKLSLSNVSQSLDESCEVTSEDGVGEKNEESTAVKYIMGGVRVLHKLSN